MTLTELLPGCVFGWETAEGLEHEAGFQDPPHTDRRPTSPSLRQRRRGAAIRKLLVAHPELVAHELLEEVRPRLPAGCVAACSGAPFVEITGAGVDKAFGIRAVCADLGVDADIGAGLRGQRQRHRPAPLGGALAWPWATPGPR